MKNALKLKTIACGTLLLGTSVANAAQTDITVTADIDPTMALTQADGTSLPDSIKMQYTPNKGLTAYKQNVKLWSNSNTKDINIQLASSPQLTDINGQNPVALSVSLDGNALTTTAITLTYASIFPSGITNGSAILPLSISQTTPSATIIAGHYTGTVSLIVTQKTT